MSNPERPSRPDLHLAVGIFKLDPSEGSDFIPPDTRTNVEDFAGLDVFDEVPASMRDIAVDVAASVIDASDTEVLVRYGRMFDKATIHSFTKVHIAEQVGHPEHVLYSRLGDAASEPNSKKLRIAMKALKIQLADLESGSQFASTLGYHPEVHTYRDFIRTPDFRSGRTLVRSAVGTFVGPTPRK